MVMIFCHIVAIFVAGQRKLGKHEKECSSQSSLLLNCLDAGSKGDDKHQWEYVYKCVFSLNFPFIQTSLPHVILCMMVLSLFLICE